MVEHVSALHDVHYQLGEAQVVLGEQWVDGDRLHHVVHQEESLGVLEVALRQVPPGASLLQSATLRIEEGRISVWESVYLFKFKVSFQFTLDSILYMLKSGQALILYSPALTIWVCAHTEMNCCPLGGKAAKLGKYATVSYLLTPCLSDRIQSIKMWVTWKLGMGFGVESQAVRGFSW